MKTITSLAAKAAMLAMMAAVIPVSQAADWVGAGALNQARQDFGAAVDECGNLWVVWGWNRTGGCANGTGFMVNTIEVRSWNGSAYADVWVTVPTDFPTPRRLHAIVFSHGFLYVIGGVDNLVGPITPLNQVVRFDTRPGGGWSTTAVPPNLTGRAEPGVVVDRMGRIWVVGGYAPGEDGLTALATTEVFDPARPELGWVPGPSLNSARGRHGCVVDRAGRIVVLGGEGFGAHVSTIEMLDPCAGTWQTLPLTLPEPSTNDAQSVYGADDRIYTVGGWHAHYWSARTLRMRGNKAAWDVQGPLAQRRSLHRVVLGRDDFIYAIAGNSDGCNSIASVEKRDTRVLYGDMNDDGFVNNFDIDAFVLCISGVLCP